ncbi:YidH family protein [Flavisolibacter nicotianae]|uniref:DUF3185 domain-containing protein n=1 Tax=Flavisolibacter nicotianae TaxID=2364882 RepID=UPI000EAF5B3B|nr:DUF3185 domain-containing protein [Flavisolibacter nicotianae]
MRGNTIIGIALLLFGFAMIVTGGFSFQQKKKVLDTGTIDISTKETKTVTWPPVVGGLVIAGGIVLLLMGGKSRK